MCSVLLDWVSCFPGLIQLLGWCELSFLLPNSQASCRHIIKHLVCIIHKMSNGSSSNEFGGLHLTELGDEGCNVLAPRNIPMRGSVFAMRPFVGRYRLNGLYYSPSPSVLSSSIEGEGTKESGQAVCDGCKQTSGTGRE